MARYSIFLRQSVGRDFDPIPKNDGKRIMNRIAALAGNPRPPGCKKLSALERYRVHQGDYRIVYSIQGGEQTVWIVKIGHRREVHRRQRNKP